MIHRFWLALAIVAAAPLSAPAETRRPVIYYQDPDGRPDYSLQPKSTAAGRPFAPVFADQEPSLDDDGAPPAPPTSAAPGGAARRILYYRHPMGLPDTSPAPKKDNMGMDYLPVYEGDDDAGTIRLTPERIQRSGVRTEPVTERVIRPVIRAPGTIQLDERRIATISLRAEGWIQKVQDVTTGSRVSRGQPLLDIYSPAMSAAAADYAAQAAIPDGPNPAAGGGRGSRQRLINLDVPEIVIAAIARSRVAPLTITWTAPRDGIVLERNAVEGARVNAGDVLFRLADIGFVWAMIDIAERDIGKLVVGQSARIRARGYPGRDFTGEVSVIYPQLNRETRSLRVRIELANADAALLPDMYVDAEIDTGSAQPVPAVPDGAVIDGGDRQFVLVAAGDGRFEPRTVTLGARDDGHVEIRSGLAQGERVVTAAAFLIDSESNLRAALRGFGQPGARP